MRLPEQDRPGRTVRFRIDGAEVTVHPDGVVALPAAFAGTSTRQVADELRARGWLPPLPEVTSTGVPEDHAYPCEHCGGIDPSCRMCVNGERTERGRR